MYSEATRSEIQTELISYIKTIPEIAGIIIVGSGAFGFTDEYSDLDFSIVVKDNVNMTAIMQQIAQYINHHYSVMQELRIPPRNLQTFLLNNYLEIDLGYAEFSHVEAKRKHWKVVYDAIGTIDQKMTDSWADAEIAADHQDFSSIYCKYSQNIYSYILLAAIAVKRNQKWRAVGEINLLRDKAIELLGCHYKVETKRYRQVDHLPDSMKSRLDNTLCDYTDSKSMYESIYHLIDIIYDELDLHFNGQYAVSRHAMKGYIKELEK